MLLERARGALPEGTTAVGVGLVVASATAYLVVIIVNGMVGDRGYAGFAVFWSLLFSAGTGLFLPLEQEVSRAIAHRRAVHVGSRPLIERAAVVGGIAAGVMAAIALGLAQPIVDNLFHGSTGLLVGFVISLFGFYAMYLARGVLSGHGRFVPYGTMVGLDGAVRLVLVAGLAIAGVHHVGAYGIAMGITPFIAVAAVLLDRHGLLEPGPHSAWTELSTALGLLLTGSVLAQVLAYLPLIVVGAGPSHAVARSFTNAFFVARIPVLMFMAVQAALLPKLARLAASEQHLDFRAALRRLLWAVVGVAILGTLVAFAFGPFVGNKIFPDKFHVSRTDLGVLAAGSGAYIIAQTLTQALIALKAYGRAAVGWIVGVLGYVVVQVALDVHLTLEVSIAFLAGSAAGAAIMGLLLAQRMRGAVPESADVIIEAITHEPVEI
ncbi:MAG: hypothetical protein U0V73_04810 [Acidimicrobiia bacterium]